MSRLLQACQSTEEAYGIVVSMSNCSRELGRPLPARSAAPSPAPWPPGGNYQPAEQTSHQPSVGLSTAAHIPAVRISRAALFSHLGTLPAVSFCLPIQVQGETIGVLQVRSRQKQI